MRHKTTIGLALCLAAVAGPAQADDTMGAPPPEAKALVEAPKDAATAPKLETPAHETTASVSAGGLLTTGNSRTAAATLNGKFDLRRGSDGFGASVVGNYGEGAPAGQGWQVTAENVQGRVRYDRYLVKTLSLFLITTARHDRFQGLDLRLNFDPGAKYLFLDKDATQLWVEAGYDLQYDIRRDDARGALDASGKPQVDANGNPVPPLLDKTATDHSARVFLGFKHAFNKDVTFSTGLEYLQSFIDSTRYRLNYDALLTANVGAGFAFGAGFSARYDHAPLPGKENLDTSTTLSVVYSFSDVKAPPPPPPPPCNCPPPPPSPAPSTVPATPPAAPPA